MLKVRQIRNDFFKPTFLPKNERTNSTLLLVDLFSLVFWKKVKTPKRYFEINWPLKGRLHASILIVTRNGLKLSLVSGGWTQWYFWTQFLQISKTYTKFGLHSPCTLQGGRGSQRKQNCLICKLESVWFMRVMFNQI